jgi:hypothetical protein
VFSRWGLILTLEREEGREGEREREGSERGESDLIKDVFIC